MYASGRPIAAATIRCRNLTEYLARAILETREQRDHHHTVKSAARDHHGRLVNDFTKAADYHAFAREFASEAKAVSPQFTDKDRIALEIYAQRQNDEAERQKYLELARSGIQAQEREVAISHCS